MNKEHIAIYIPGLGNTNSWTEWWARKMTSPGFRVDVFDANWQKGHDDLSEKLGQLTKRIEDLSRTGLQISLIGTSAGGSLALLAFHQLQREISSVIAICACLRIPSTIPKTLEQNLHNFPAHKRAVTMFEKKVEPELSLSDRKRILTIQPLWDNVVPRETMTISGVENQRILSFSHVPSIAAGLTIYSRTITNFIRQS